MAQDTMKNLGFQEKQQLEAKPSGTREAQQGDTTAR